MRQTVAFIDAVLFIRDFVTDDFVRKTTHKDTFMTPYTGRVLYSNPVTGRVYVQWPWGAEQESPMDLIHDVSGTYLPPSMDQCPQTWEAARWVDGEAKSKEDKKWRKSLSTVLVDKYEEKTLPIWRDACRLSYDGADEVSAYVTLASKFSNDFGDDAVRLTVSNLWELGRRLAIYWKDKKRRYKVTQQEKTTQKLACPRCRSFLRPRTYRQGRRFLLCKSCGFSISPQDLVK